MSIHYTFPIITHITNVLPFIEGKPEFIHVKKDGYSVINYTYMTDKTFPTVTEDNLVEASILRECRGLIFDADGNVISRRYHKFFNAGERSDTQIDLSRDHVILEKLDGSMISPIMLNGGVRWTSKMGITPVSMQAECFVAEHSEYEALARMTIYNDITPIFEWCSRQQRIVIDYPEDRLVLTALRVNTTGFYLPYQEIKAVGDSWGVPVVNQRDVSNANIEEVIKTVREFEGEEGVVVRFNDGHMAKVKAEAYIIQHRAKDAIGSERHATKVILENLLDDYLPILPPADAENVQRFADAIYADLMAFGELVTSEKHTVVINDMSRKHFALSSVKEQMVRSAMFSLWDEPLNMDFPGKAWDYGKDYLIKACGSNTSFKERAGSILKTAKMKEIAL